MSSATILDEPLNWLDSVIQAPSSNSLLTIFNHPSPHAQASSSGSSPLSDNQHSPNLDTPSPATPPSTSPPTQSTQNASSSTAPSTSKAPRRRIRPKIALDPSQPLTARGKPRARVYVACDQCRVRKTRCDGAKPVCFNCRKRPPEVGQCSYDSQPNRRGQDKAPGTRTRSSASHKSKRRKTSRGSDDDDNDNDSDSDSSTHKSGSVSEVQPETDLHATYDNFPGLLAEDEVDEYDPFPLVDLDSPGSGSEFSLGRYAHEVQQAIPARPSLKFTRDTWWDALLTFYSTDTSSADVITLSSDQRSDAVLCVVSDLRALFHASVYWLSFIHIPRFFERLLSPTSRASMQPSLVMSGLAIGILSQSSEAERGAAGRVKALKLIEHAHSSLQASMAAGWVDIELIQAAWLIVYFELQTHPLRSAERSRSSLILLDSLIRLFSLTTLDADINAAHTVNRPPMASTNVTAIPASFDAPVTTAPVEGTPLYAGAAVPGFFSHLRHNFPLQTGVNFNLPQAPPTHLPPQPLVSAGITFGPSTTHPPAECNCPALSLESNWPGVREIAPAWATTLIWPEDLPAGEFKKEECRRLVWATVMLTASVNSYNTSNQVVQNIERNDLWVKDPDNFALLFPGEALAMHGAPVHVNNVWTLYLRSMLLLHTCIRKRGDMTLSDAERAQFAMYAWVEVDALEAALGQHTCTLQRNSGFHAQEMLFSARMCISHEFQRYIPQVTTTGSRLFYRDKAEAWLRNRMVLAERVWQNLLQGVLSPALDYRKPLLVYWFMAHIIKALALWEADPTLVIALEASKTFAKRAEYMMMFWPSDDQRREWADIRLRLIQACFKSGISPPSADLPGPIPRMNAKLRNQPKQ